MGYFAAKQPPQSFDEAMGHFVTLGDAWHKKNREHPCSDAIDRLLGSVRRYLHFNEYFNR